MSSWRWLPQFFHLLDVSEELAMTHVQMPHGSIVDYMGNDRVTTGPTYEHSYFWTSSHKHYIADRRCVHPFNHMNWWPSLLTPPHRGDTHEVGRHLSTTQGSCCTHRLRNAHRNRPVRNPETACILSRCDNCVSVPTSAQLVFYYTTAIIFSLFCLC